MVTYQSPHPTLQGFLLSKKPLLAAVILAILAILLVIPADDTYTDEGDDDPQYRVPEKAEPRYPDLGTSLNRMVASVEAGQAVEKVTDNGAVHNAGMVAVSIYLSGETDGVVSFLEDNGGSPRNVGEDYIEAYVPVPLLGQVSEQPGVLRVREIIPPQQTGPAATGDGEDIEITLPEKTELKYPNLGSRLDQLVAGVEDGEASTREAAEDAPVHQEESVAVTIYLSGNVDGVVSFLEDNGGSPRNVSEDYIEAYVPVPLLGQVSEQFGVLRVREIVPAEEHQSTQRIAGQGPQAHGSPAWNQAGYSGQGVKVGVIESFFGFNDFSSLMGTELPSTVQARCYTDVGRFTQNVADCADALVGSAHGTWVAEAVMDIAPEASLYIASPWSRGDTNSAVDWMVSQGVSVIVSAQTSLFDGPGDGTSPFGDSPLRTVDRAVAGGIIWANAAGNYAQRTWFGPYSTVELGDSRYLRFYGSDIFNDMLLDAGDRITVQLRWDDSWSGASRDFDLLVWDIDASAIVAYSYDLQGGRAGQVPSEELRYLVPSDGRYAVVVAHDSGGTPDWLQVTVRGVGSIGYYTESGSIGNPGESANPGMLAAGAAYWNNLRTIEPYSSRGPTPDRRVKPDIVGADCGATELLPLNVHGDGFCGTSQSAAHVAGMAVLVRQGFPHLTAAQVASYLKENAEQRGSPDPNNTWGHGFAKLPLTTPAVTCLTGGAVADTANNPGLAADCEVLLAAKDTLAGSATLDWSVSVPIDQWEGVTVGGTGRRVTGLNLGDKGLTGRIPAELGSLIYLENLFLTRNELTGIIPPGLGQLTNLGVLALGANQLAGPIPTWLGSLVNLEQLYLWGNQLTGPIPSELGSLSNLEELFLSGNQLTGPIPAELGNLPGLVKLGLSGNRLTGQIPPQLASLTNLQYFSLFDNQLSGPVPTWLGSLVNLEQLYLWGNQLTGPIPSELGSLSNLEELFLSQNQLTGPIPSELGSLSNLEELFLSQNQLTGPIPTELGSLANLQELYLWENQLTGPIPAELGSLANLQELYLWENQLTGPIPAELGSLTSLQVLSLSQNQLTGPIPAELGSLANLQELYLWENQLTGPIPAELGSLTSLQVLSLSQNQLTGPIPAELGSLANLQRLSLWGNQLTGAIPTELGSLANLQELYLWENQLTGPIPASLGSLSKLQGLYLWGNQLTGPIPSELGSLSNLEELFLSGNQLTGCIPVGIAGVANNDLSQLGLPFCAGALGAPTIGTLTPGADFLTITWAAPTGSPESAIIAYDLRYIESAARDKSDVNWTVVDNAWTAGSGASSYQIAGLTDGTQYDVQVRAVTAAGDGPWSAAAAGTPATWGAIRSFSPPSVAPAGEVVVMITASGYGAFGEVVETLPPGFRYVSRSLSDSGVTAVGREVRFSLFGQTAFTYTVTAPSAAGTYSFSGVLRNADRKDVAVGGALTIAVAAGDPLIVRYDANGNGMIEKSEVINAINDYLFGEGDEAISKAEVIRLINLYLFG